MVKLLSKLPLSFLYLVSDLIYFLIYYLVGYRKKVVYHNIKNAFPSKTDKETKNIARGFYKNLSDIIIETIKAISISEEELRKRITIKNKEVLQQYIEKGKISVIAMTSHQCNWEWVLLGCGVHYPFSMNGIYKPLSNPYFQRLMLGIRSRFGGNPIPMASTVMEIIKKKNEPRAYGFVADQAPMRSHRKYWTEFLNQDTAFFVGAEKIAQLTKFPAIFIGMKRIKRGYYEINMKKLSSPPYHGGSHELLERYAREVEKQIIENPSDWLWSHKRWKYKKATYA